jgi:hypothetical protein
MNKELQQKLERPFDANVVKKRRGPGGKDLSYVAVTEYVKRLNECFGTAWGFEITSREQFENQVIVEGRLVAGGVVKSGIGGAELRRSRDGELLSLADAFKAASSDALKRCCRLLGIGLALYDGEDVPAKPAPPTKQGTGDFSAFQRQDAGGRISRAQLSKLRELVYEVGSQWPSFKAWVKEEHGVAIEYASKRLASELIGDLIKANARRGNGRYPQQGEHQ